MEDLSTKRTCGDGMENVETIKQASEVELQSEKVVASCHSRTTLTTTAKTPTLTAVSSIPGAYSIYRGRDCTEAAVKLPSKSPQGKVFYLVPRLVPNKKSTSLRNKEPKFVPFEPYKAAVTPLVPPKRVKKCRITNRNNLDLSILVSQVSHMTTNELNSSTSAASVASDGASKERFACENETMELRKERDYLESQLKFQVQVNSELKNLLVAAVGEDLQTRVNVLTEDKLQLARALLNSAHNLSTHTEQIEYLAGQSEVWRSKFLASSLMVEELARWKASLTQKNKLLLESNKQMLQTMSQLRDMQIETLKNLNFLGKIRDLNLPSSNVLDVTSEGLNISQYLILHSGIGMPSPLDLNGLDTTTDAEKLAVEALQTSNQTLISTDEAFRAIVGQAFPSNKTTSETQTPLDFSTEH